MGHKVSEESNPSSDPIAEVLASLAAWLDSVSVRIQVLEEIAKQLGATDEDFARTLERVEANRPPNRPESSWRTPGDVIEALRDSTERK